MRKISTAIVALATLTLAAPASAGEIWLNGSSSSAGSDDRYYSDGTVNVRVSAWSIDNNGIIRDSDLDVYSYGIGIDNDGYDQHTIDNSGWRDFLVFQFDQSVALDTAYFNNDGWHDFKDTDATIAYGDSPFAYTSALPLDGVTFASGPNFYASNTDPNDFYDSVRNINPNGYQGNFWLIGASFDSPSEYHDGRWKNYYDSFKLKKLTYDIPTTAVPEPATWLMMIFGFGLVGGTMRREKRKGAPAIA